MQVFFNSCSDAINYANENKSFGCFYSTHKNTTTDIHVHECCEIFFCVSGGKTFFIGEHVYEANAGDIFLLNPFEAHKVTSSQSQFERFVMHVHPAFLYNNSTLDTDLAHGFFTRNEGISQKLSLNSSDIEEFNSYINIMKQNFEYGDDIQKHIAALRIIVFVNKLFTQQNQWHSNPYRFENKTIEQSLHFINTNFDQPLSLEIIAKNSYISVNELCRLFKKYLGTTVTKYILSKRITEAKKLLNSGKSVGETAHSCGFQDYANFIRSFKKIVGISPGKYAALCKSES